MTSTIQEYLSFLYFSLRFQFKQGQTYNCCRTDEYFCAIQDTVVSPFTPHIIPVDSVSSDHMIKTAFVTKAGIMFIFIIDCFFVFFLWWMHYFFRLPEWGCGGAKVCFCGCFCGGGASSFGGSIGCSIVTNSEKRKTRMFNSSISSWAIKLNMHAPLFMRI